MSAAIAPAAAVAGLKEAGGIIAGIFHALEKPIYQDVVTSTTSKVNADGILVVTTHTKGWSVPLGVPVLIVGAIVVWEIGLSISKAIGAFAGAAEGVVKGAEDLMNPANWPTATANFLQNYTIGGVVAGNIGNAIGQEGAQLTQGGFFSGSSAKLVYPPAAGGSTAPSSPSSQTVKIPPTFMAHLSLAGQQFLAVGTGPASVLLSKLGLPSPGA